MKRLLLPLIAASFIYAGPAADYAGISGMSGQAFAQLKPPGDLRRTPRKKPGTVKPRAPTRKKSAPAPKKPSSKPATAPPSAKPRRPATAPPSGPGRPPKAGSPKTRPPTAGPPKSSPPSGRPPRSKPPVAGGPSRPPGTRPPGYHPPHWRPSHWRPPYYRPPYHRPPHRYWGRYYWYPSWGWYNTAIVAGATLAFIAALPSGDNCEPIYYGDETLYRCNGVLYRPTTYRDEQVYEIVSAAADPAAAETLPPPEPDIELQLTSPFMRGEKVRTLQTVLAAIGFDVGTDGVFGRGTDTAVRAFQEWYGLPMTGIVDEDTANAIGWSYAATLVPERPAGEAADEAAVAPEPAPEAAAEEPEAAAEEPPAGEPAGAMEPGAEEAGDASEPAPEKEAD